MYTREVKIRAYKDQVLNCVDLEMIVSPRSLSEPVVMLKDMTANRGFALCWPWGKTRDFRSMLEGNIWDLVPRAGG